MVSIGIIAVLLAIAIPALAGARDRARQTVGLSNLRQTGQAMQLYVQAYGGYFPWAREGSGFIITPENPPVSILTPGYWGLAQYWSSLFHQVAPWPEWFRLWVFPDPRRDADAPWKVIDPDAPFANGVSSLEFSRALFARPEVWSEGDLISDRDAALRAVRFDWVRYPSSKVQFFDRELCVRIRCADELSAKRSMLFVDGHAALHELGNANAPVLGRLPYFQGGTPYPVHDTDGGALGRDY